MAEWSFEAGRFRLVWDWLNLGDLPFPVQAGRVGRTASERAALVDRAKAELRAAGLFHTGPDARLAAALTTLARADTWFDSTWLAGGDSPVRVVTARRDGHLVHLRQEPGPTPHRGGDVRITELDDPDLVHPVATELPDTPPGSWRPDPVPVDALTAPVPAAESPWEDGTAVSKELRELLCAPHPAGGQIAACTRDAAGHRARLLATRWFDRADDGRYQAVTSTAADGRQWITVSPLDDRTLRAVMVSTLGDLVAGGR
ncbi:ESX secretion-associated protein EspG [Actinokineospora sp. G85]|uniref:ESX secretion-associated protein EspG n=1 Tax=Actinokineospora sp. G85 TaxID=3406626 RepID=UPI003C75AFCC